MAKTIERHASPSQTGGATVSMAWKGLGHSEYDDLTEWAEYHPPRIEGSAWVGLRNAVIIEVLGGGFIWMLWRVFR